MVILRIERALPVDGWPLARSYKEVTAKFVRLGRLLLFIGRNKEADNADDNKRVLKQFTICNHKQPPFPEIRGQRSCPLSEGPTVRRYWQR